MIQSMPSMLQPGAACKRSRLPPWVRLSITFAVLLALKYALPEMGVAPTAQVLVLLLTATCFAWLFWWNCSPDRRGVLALVVILWIAGAVKILRFWGIVPAG